MIMKANDVVDQAIVITHPEQGVYLGSCMGLGFWSMLDPGGQDSACVFPSQEQAIAFIRTWDENNDPANYSFSAVTPTLSPRYASVEDLKNAGLSTLLGEMDIPPKRVKRPTDSGMSGPGM